ncbi:isochorismatase family protein [Klebsiella pneumoniae]|nr:isochorismatase family protein [Klebsiella pneumoniae]
MNASEEERSIVSELRPENDEAVLTKWRYSAFFNTKLEDILHHRKIKQMFICGVYAHIGILTTALDSYSRDIETFLVSDAIADFSLEEHTQALRFAAGSCAKLATVRDLINVE